MLSKRLALERQRLGWTQNELAERLGISRSVVALMEGGRSAIYIERILALEAHGFDLPFILWGTRSAVLAGELLDWALLAEVQRGIRDWCEIQGVQLKAEKESALLKLLYKHFADQGHVTQEGMQDALTLAA